MTETSPRARYLVPMRDWEASIAKAKRSISDPNEALARETRPFLNQVQPLESTGKLGLFDGEHSITSAITTLPIPWAHARPHVDPHRVRGGASDYHRRPAAHVSRGARGDVDLSG